MTQIPRHLQDTRGEKVWALDIACAVLWYELWQHHGWRGQAANEYSEDDLKHAMAILDRMSNGLAKQRGRLHR